MKMKHAMWSKSMACLSSMTTCVVFTSLLLSSHAQRGSGGLFDQDDCTSAACCKSSDQEIYRSLSCSIFVFLDSDPVLQMEGCKKQRSGCVTMCNGDAYDTLFDAYAECDRKFDKDVMYSDWNECWSNSMISGILKGMGGMSNEKVPASTVSGNLCDLLTQPGCPLCVKMAWASPCANQLIRNMCPVQCKSCFCTAPNRWSYNALGLTCEKTGTTGDRDTPISKFGDTCDVSCGSGEASDAKLRCVNGGWVPAGGDSARCMKNCPDTTASIKMPPGGTELARTGTREKACTSLLHGEKCRLSCEDGKTPSAYWKCFDGNVVSTRPGYQPQCLNNCGEPPAPWKGKEFGKCTNPTLDDPDAKFESSAFYNTLTGKQFSVDFRAGLNTSIWTSATPLRDRLESEGSFDALATTCSALKQENDNDPINDKFTWRRRLVDDPPELADDSPSSDLGRRLGDESNDENATMLLPAFVPSGSECEVHCEYPFSSVGKYVCWDGTYTAVPTCSVQLYNEGYKWPHPEGSIVSDLGSVYVNYNLDVIMPARQKLKVGEYVKVCAGEGLGCPTGECFSSVPVEDGSRVTTKGSQLRIHLGWNLPKQHFGCGYQIVIPAGTVVAVLDRSIENAELKWNYRLDPPPPRLMKMELEPSFNSVEIRVKFNAPGTIKCLTTAKGVKPTEEAFDVSTTFWTQTGQDKFAGGTLTDLEEKTQYSVWCRGEGLAGVSQSMIDVWDNEVVFTTKSKVPYILSMSVSNLGNTAVEVTVLYTSKCTVRCRAHQNQDLSAIKSHAMQSEVKVQPAKVFQDEPIKYELTGLIPNMHTVIVCWAVAKDTMAEDDEPSEYPQEWQDSWDNRIETKTPPMDIVDLASLTATGCTLVPNFAPTRTVYACQVPPTGSSVTLAATVPPAAYSNIECDPGSQLQSCSKQYTVSQTTDWTFTVTAQSGRKAEYMVVMMKKSDLKPEVVKPTNLTATTQNSDITVCAKAEAAFLSKVTKQSTTAYLLPGAWKFDVIELSKGASLPTCSAECGAKGIAGCNVELKLNGRGAGTGEGATLVIEVDGIPSFSLDKGVAIYFDEPKVTDVIPPNPSIHEKSELTVYGENFGGSPAAQAKIVVKKKGPYKIPKSAPWMDRCPLLIVNVGTTDREDPDKDIRWIGWEFNGRYKEMERNKYEMTREKKILLTDAQVAEIDENDANFRKACTPRCPEPVRAKRKWRRKDELVKQIVVAARICCMKGSFDILGFDDEGDKSYIFISMGENGEDIRRLPELKVIGKVWQADSRNTNRVRMHSQGMYVDQPQWIAKWPKGVRPPGPGEERPSNPWGGRRMFDETDLVEELTKFQGDLMKMAQERRLSHDRKKWNYRCDLEEHPRDCEDCPHIPRNWTKNQETGYCECEEGVNDDGAVQALIEEMGYGDMLPKDQQKCTMLKNSCGIAGQICQCYCAGFDPTPENASITVEVTCERCGDTVVVGWEKCDDGNTRDGDGCSRTCAIEPGWTCPPGGGACTEINPKPEPPRPNLCGATTWVDDKTLKCDLMSAALDNLELSVVVFGQEGERATHWVQYQKPQVRSIQLGILEVVAGSTDDFTPILEFAGGQRLICDGRSLPPTLAEAQKHGLRLLVDGEPLCVGADVKSTTQFECQQIMAINLDNIQQDPWVTVMTGEVESDAVRLSSLGIRVRQPSIEKMVFAPKEKRNSRLRRLVEHMAETVSSGTFNDTNVKRMEISGSSMGTKNAGTLKLSVAGSPCMITYNEERNDTVHEGLHEPKKIVCFLHYVPPGKHTVEMKLGNIPAVSVANVTVLPTYCHRGERRIVKEYSDCTTCDRGTAVNALNDNFTCPNCSDAFYQDEVGMTDCKACVDHTFSVPDRGSKAHCRCKAGYFHPHADAARAEKCNKCEQARGFGWATAQANWTLDCGDECVQKFSEPPENWFYFGQCEEECYGLTCDACPLGGVCFGNAAWPRALPGFWAHDIFSDQAQKIERCMPMEACFGDDGTGKMVCGEGYEGIRCGVCEVGYYKEQHLCAKCPTNQWIFAMIFALFFCTLLIFGIIPALTLFMKRMIGVHEQLPLIWRCWFKCCCCFRNCCKLPPEEEDYQPPPPGCCKRCCYRLFYPKRCIEAFKRWDAQLSKAPLLRTLAMCLNFGHTCYAFAMLQRPQVNWPAPSWELLSWTKLLTVDVEFMKPDCVVQMPFFTKWVGKFFMPFGMFLLLLIITLYLKATVNKIRNSGSATGIHVNSADASKIWQVFRFSLALIIHVILIWHLKVALSPVDCNWCREGVKCLDEYTLVECWSDDPTWVKMMILSCIDFVFVSGFFPIFLTVTIYRSWKATANKVLEPQQGLSFTSFFVNGYRDRETGGNVLTYGWEVVVLFRKLALIVSAKFTTSDPILGANLQLLILLGSLVLQLTLRPYKADILSNIDNFLCVLLFISLLSACQLTMKGLGDFEHFYTVVNIIALFGGAATGILVCLRKLQFAYLAETRERNEAFGTITPVQVIEVKENKDAAGGGAGDGGIVIEDQPIEDVKEADDQPVEEAEEEETGDGKKQIFV